MWLLVARITSRVAGELPGVLRDLNIWRLLSLFCEIIEKYTPQTVEKVNRSLKK